MDFPDSIVSKEQYAYRVAEYYYKKCISERSKLILDKSIKGEEKNIKSKKIWTNGYINGLDNSEKYNIKFSPDTILPFFILIIFNILVTCIIKSDKYILE